MSVFCLHHAAKGGQMLNVCQNPVCTLLGHLCPVNVGLCSR
jgi:hypothetical protein